jgi:YegS/Rv2252/BmrU family lipid kinase
MAFPYQKITVIINPVSGLENQAQTVISDYLAALPHLEITYCFTSPEQSAYHFAKQALESDSQLVVAYGGDGTQAQVATALKGSSVPMGVLAGGTGNVMAAELGIPTDLRQALDLIFQQPHRVRQVDMGCLDNQPFLLRAGIGYEAQATATAPRAAKRKRGRLAYMQHALAQLKKLRRARYVITVDGQTHVVRGITCLICNSTNVGMKRLKLLHESSVSDGLLDVVVSEGLGVGALLRMAISIFQSVLPKRLAAKSPIRHWQGKNITVEIRPSQLVGYDGEKLKQARRVSAYVIPNAVRMIVPIGADI